MSESAPESILKDFIAAYDLQMQLITPHMRNIWQDEFAKDPKKFEHKFIKLENVAQLRRLLANSLYGTRQHLPKGSWEAPFVQAFID